MSRILVNFSRLLSAAAVLTILAGVGHAQFPVVVAEDDFDSYADTSFIVFTDGTGLALVPDGDGGNAIQFTRDATPGGFLATGFDFQPIVQPSDTGTNLSSSRASYQVSFDLTIDSDYIPGNGIEVWLKDPSGQGDPESDPSASLYSIGLGSFVTGVPQTVSFILEPSVTDTPFAHENGSGYNPDLVDLLQVRFNALDFNSPGAGNTQDPPNLDPVALAFTVDNFSLRTVPEPTTCALLLGGVAMLFAARRRRMG